MLRDTRILPDTVPRTNPLTMWRELTQITDAAQALRNREDFWCTTYLLAHDEEPGDDAPKTRWITTPEHILFACWARDFHTVTLPREERNYLLERCAQLADDEEAYFVYSQRELIAWGFQYDTRLELASVTHSGWQELHAEIIHESNNY